MIGITDEELEEHIRAKDPKRKEYICEFWLKGYCYFFPSICHYAHGCDDLIHSIE
jgi:hypothetical protein